MRRVVSAIFLFLGGWLLTAEPILAFMDFGPGMGGAMPAVLAFVLLLAAVPLGIGVALSPGRRWRELGLTILIASGMAAFTGLGLAAMFLDPGFKQFMPAMPPLPDIAPAAGTLNLIALVSAGLLLYGRRRISGRGAP